MTTLQELQNHTKVWQVDLCGKGSMHKLLAIEHLHTQSVNGLMTENILYNNNPT